jgi:hypothetical protein
MFFYLVISQTPGAGFSLPISAAQAAPSRHFKIAILLI